jgi:predicted nucleotidyltransferase
MLVTNRAMSSRSRRTPARSTPRLEHLRRIILPIARAHGARNVRIFGSFARGAARKTSDIDLLVTLPGHASLLDLAGLKVELEESLRRKVDVLTDDGISPYLRERILREATPL